MREKTEILILGTYHFRKCGGHLIDDDPGDMLSDKKQREINELIEKLIRFNPTKIAVEAKREKEKEINNMYTEYCKNGQAKDEDVVNHRNEIVQVAFKMGNMLNHSKIYPLDCPIDLPDEMLQYAEENSKEVYKDFMNYIESQGKEFNEVIQNKTVLEIFKYLNNPSRIAKEHSDLYLHMAQVGSGDNYCGGDFLTEWYRRNLYILGNLQAIAELEDRILVIYGAGHCKILRDFVKDYDKFQFVEAMEYLE